MDHGKLGWTDRCCICGRQVVSWNNPYPIRSGEENCCNDCNLLVRAARERISRIPEAEAQSFVLRLRSMDLDALAAELLPEKPQGKDI